MLIHKAYKYRIYPNITQEILLNKTFGCVRYFWNKQVETFNSYHKDTNPTPIFNSSTKIRNEFKWFKEVSAAAIQQKEIDFKEYKAQRFSKNRKKKLGNPSFKKKSNAQSYRLPNQKFKLLENKIQLEKIGKVKIIIDRKIPLNSKFISVTVSKNSSNQYFASILIVENIEHLPKTSKEVGIDVGLKDFLTQSDNIVVSNPKYLRNNQAKLKRLQQFHAKKVKGSVNRKKLTLKIARFHQKIKNKRNWFLHNESLRIVKNYDIICIEDLNVAGMLKNHKLAKSISDVSWSEFFTMLEYKSHWFDKELIKVDRFAPTSKLCGCGKINKNLKLSDRIWTCDFCGSINQRDLLAANNIKALGVNNAIRMQSVEII